MAANRRHVPKFGNWEDDSKNPYTSVFDKARKGRTDGRMINPNDPLENPDLFAQHQPNLGARGSVSSDLEGKSSSNSSHGTSGRSKGKPASRGDDETPNRVTVLPKFGDWDVIDPASADDYAQVFKKAGEHCVDLGASFPPGRDPYFKNDRVKVSCFLWWWWK